MSAAGAGRSSPRREVSAVGHGHDADDHDGELTAEEAWARTAEAGIKVLRIPTPFAVGRVNLYLLEDDPLTLIDTGPNSGKALDELDRQLRSLGHRLDRIERIVLTHQHIDHTGLAAIVAERSGAELVAIDLLAPFLADYPAQTRADDEFAAELMRRHGIPEDMVVALKAVSASFRAWGAGAEVSRAVHDGELLEFRDRSLEVQLRPGHSPTDTLFWDAERSLLIGGDHLLGHISSNPLMSRRLDGGEGRQPALVNYLGSLGQTRGLPAQIVLPGHGEPVTGHAALIESRFRMHRRRADKLLGLLSEGPRTAHELAHELWGNVAVTQAFLTLSEVVGHMDLLVTEGRVEEVVEDGVALFVSKDS